MYIVEINETVYFVKVEDEKSAIVKSLKKFEEDNEIFDEITVIKVTYIEKVE